MSKIQIFIKTLDGKTRKYDATAVTTVKDIFLMIEEKEGVSSDQIWLSYQGKPLTTISSKKSGSEVENQNEEMTLADFGIIEKATILANKRMVGGGKIDCLSSAGFILQSVDMSKLGGLSKEISLPLEEALRSGAL